MEQQQVLVLAGVDVQQNDAYYLPLICQDYAHLVPFASVKDFNPGSIEQRLFQVYVFKVKKELKKKSDQKDDLPNLPRQVLEGTQKISFKQNGKITTRLYQSETIVKRTLTVAGKDYSLWEYVLAEDTTWTVLHHYMLKRGKRPREEDEAEVTTNEEQIPLPNIGIYQNYELNQQDLNMTNVQYVPGEDYMTGDSGIAQLSLIEVLQGNGINLPDATGEIYGTDHQYEQLEVEPNTPIIADEVIDDVMHEDDRLLPDIPTHVYYQLLTKSIAEKRFFNTPIRVHEDLFIFKCKRETESEVDELSLRDMTGDNFEFLTSRQLIHLVSPAGTGKTMAMLQLAKSFEREQENLVTVLCKAEYFWRDIGVNGHTMLDGLVHASMITADIREHRDQDEWRENLSRVIRRGTGVILLLDAIDEMKSQERDGFLNYVNEMAQVVPGHVQDVNIVALVVSSRPGVELAEGAGWTPLKMAKVKHADHVLRTLCAEDSAALSRAKSLQQNFKFPQTLFWYSLLAIEARRIDPDRPIATSQFEFLGEMLLQSIKITQQKKGSLDADQQELLSEDPTVLLQVAALTAYLAKRLGTTRIIDIEPHLSSLIITSCFPPSFYNASGQIIKKLLPFYQFCHCCFSCAEDSTEKFVKFDHQIIWDYLAADFIVKTVVKKNYPSLLDQLNQSDAVNFEWQKYVKLSGLPNSEWAQPLHLVAEALPVTQFTTTIKACDEQRALAWVNNVFNHPRCSDVEDRSLSFVKLFVSCLFNASKKPVNNASETHMKKKTKDSGSARPEDDQLTAIGFNLALKLFGQPAKGQFNFEDICVHKPLSQFFNEIALRGRNQEFVELIIKKFDSDEPRVPEELISFVKEIRSDFDIQHLMEGLFYRMSSKCAVELLAHPMRVAISIIFADVFKEDRCFDFLQQKLANMDDTSVQASAMTILMRFPTLRADRVRRMLAMIQLSDEQQRVITAFPRQLPLEVFDDMRTLVLTCDSTLWTQMFQAFDTFTQESQECYDKCFELFDHFKTYIIGMRKFTKPKVNGEIVVLTTEQMEKLMRIYQDPAAFYQLPLEKITCDGIKACIVRVAKLQELTEEQKRFFDLMPKPRLRAPRRFKIHGKQYEADSFENYLQSFCSSPITSDLVMVLSHVYITNYAEAPEPALIMLEHVAEQFRTVLVPTVPSPMIDEFYRGFFDRRENHLRAADVIMNTLEHRQYPLNNVHIGQFIVIMTNYAANLRMGVRDEWHTLVKLDQCQNLLLAQSKLASPIRWSVENMVALWKLLGTVHYQTCCREKISQDQIPIILNNWSREDIEAFLEIVADLESGSKLQHEVEQSVTNLLKDRR